MSNEGTPFPSRYVGICPRCRTMFENGTMVARIPDEEIVAGIPGKYAHADPNECTVLDPLEGKPTKFKGSSLDDMGY